MWECAELSACECFPGHDGKDAPFFYRWPKREHRTATLSLSQGWDSLYWANLIETYSTLGLSFEKDKMPAFSGIAQQLLGAGSENQYLAGLWRNTIIADLCWTPFAEPCRRPSVWRSPSWSWMSVDGAIRVCSADDDHDDDGTDGDHCQLVDASVSPAGQDVTGELSCAHIVLCGPLCHAEVVVEVNLPARRFELQKGETKISVDSDCVEDFGNGPFAIGRQLACLRLRRLYCGDDFCLVLKRECGDEYPTYSRVGSAYYPVKDYGELWFSPEAARTLVKLI